MNLLPFSDRRVAIARDTPAYSATAPFHPSESFPEWPGAVTSPDDNPAYRAVRKAFQTLGLDSGRFGTPQWNPLGDLIQPGNSVVIKPNLVAHRNLGERAYGLTDTDSLITHGSIIRVVLDYAGKALRGQGTILIADCPLQGTSWPGVVKLAGLDSIEAYCKQTFPGIRLEIRDFRLGRALMRNGNVVTRVVDERNRSDYKEVDLGTNSYLEPICRNEPEFGVAQYGRKRLRAAHGRGRHKYLIPRPVLEADVFLNLPKLKTHMKAGLTCALKNLVGINGHKDYLPHFRFGSPKQGGDEYPDGGFLWDCIWRLTHADWDLDSGLRKRISGNATKVLARVMRALGYHRSCIELGGGSWHGNDTVWRTVLDINAALLYYDKADGSVGPTLRKDFKYLAIVDGLIGGDKEGPLAPEPIKSGIVMAGANPLAVDSTAAALMGFDTHKTRQVRDAFGDWKLPLAGYRMADIVLAGLHNITSINDIYTKNVYERFTPARGFAGHLEYGQDTMRSQPVNEGSLWRYLSEHAVLRAMEENA